MKLKMENYSCLWSHKWKQWEQEEPYKIYANSTEDPKKAYLYYTIYTQKRFCNLCNKMEVKKVRVNNY